MDQRYPLVCSPLPEKAPAPDGNDDQATDADQPTEMEPGKKPGPIADQPKGIETRQLTDAEREAAYAMILWWSMYGGC